MKFLLNTVILFIFVSCGKNAFLKSNSRIITAVEGTEEELHVKFTPSNMDFDYIKLNDEKSKTLTLTNDGDVEIYSIDNPQSFMSDDTYQVDLSNCKNGLAVGESCEVEINFKSTSSVSGEQYRDIKFRMNEREDFLYSVRGEIIDDSLDDGGLTAEYSNKKKVNFKKTYLGSSYRKLIYLRSKVGSIKIKSLYPKSDENLKLNFSNSNLACNQNVSSGCFIELSFTPSELGKFKSKIMITYTDNEKVGLYHLELDVLAKVVQSEECYDFDQQVDFPKSQTDYNQYELSLSYPYCSSVPSSPRVLESVVNTAFTQTIDIYDMQFQFNRDTQVFFSYEYRARQGELVNSSLLLNLLKYEDIKNDSYDTEVLCNLDSKRCTGKRFIERSYRRLINRSFKVMNDRFSKEIVYSKQSLNKGLKFYKLKSEFELNKYLRLNTKKLQKYSQENESLSFVIADDVKLEEDAILVSTRRKIRSCN